MAEAVLLVMVTPPATGNHNGSARLSLYCNWKFVPALAGHAITGAPLGVIWIAPTSAGGLMATVSASMLGLPLKSFVRRSEAHDWKTSVVLSPLNTGARERLFARRCQFRGATCWRGRCRRFCCQINRFADRGWRRRQPSSRRNFDRLRIVRPNSLPANRTRRCLRCPMRFG